MTYEDMFPPPVEEVLPIYVLDLGSGVVLAGHVTNDLMDSLGYKPYYGPIPEGDYLIMKDGVLVAVDPPAPPASEES